MAKEYKVTLQDDTVYEIKQILNIGTTKYDPDDASTQYIIGINGVYPVEDFIDHDKIVVQTNGAMVNIPEGSTAENPITENGHHKVVTFGEIETETGPVKTYTGTEFVNVAIPAERYITKDNLNADLALSLDHEEDMIHLVASNATPGYAYGVLKPVGLCVWADEADTQAGLGKLKLNVTRDECIKHYYIDEVTNYTHFADLKVYHVHKDSTGDLLFDVEGKIRTEDGKSKYPYTDEHVLTECLHFTVADLNKLLDEVGYKVVEK